MRTISNYETRPDEIEVVNVGGRATVYIRRNITSRTVTDEDGTERTEWTAVEYSAQVNALRFTPDETFCAAVIQREYDDAAAKVRARRDALLAASDADMALDRLGLSVPSGTTFTAWLSFLKGLGDVLSGDIAKYRQALRDVPAQDGFPFDVEWPEI